MCCPSGRTRRFQVDKRLSRAFHWPTSYKRIRSLPLATRMCDRQHAARSLSLRQMTHHELTPTEPGITRHLPCFPPLGVPLERLEDRQANIAALSREAAERERAMLESLNRGSAANQKGPPPPPDLLPPMPQDSVAPVVNDKNIYQRGVAIDKDKLVSLGQERFPQLLAHEREARAEQRAVGVIDDLTDWPNVFVMFARSAHSAASRSRSGKRMSNFTA